jgi:ribosomal protein S21
MKATVKLLALFTISVFSQTLVTAQLKIGSVNSITADVKKVLEDYPNHFDHILGEMIIQNPQSADYACNFKVSGAEECTITRYTGKNNSISSWQAVMLTTEDFDAAKKRFKSLYGQLNNLAFKSMRLKGTYEAPTEEKKFTSVLFSFEPADESLKKLKVELVIEAELMEWKIKLLVYDRDRDDDQRGEVIE